jgi:hypothetical protein
MINCKKSTMFLSRGVTRCAVLIVAAVCRQSEGAALRNSGNGRQLQEVEEEAPFFVTVSPPVLPLVRSVGELTKQVQKAGVLKKNVTAAADHLHDQQCPNLMPTVYASQTDPNIERQYNQYYIRQVKKYKRDLAPGTLVQNPELDMTVLPEADFVLWGEAERGVLEMSAYNKNETLVMAEHNGMRFVPPSEKDFTQLEGVRELHGSDYAVFVGLHYDVFAHFLIDFLPYIAYLKDTLPPTTRLLMADARNSNRPRLEALDPEFAKRVDWIECPKTKCRNQMVRIRGGSFSIMHPVSSLRHMELLVRARRWIFETHAPTKELMAPQNRTVIYYTRNSVSAGHGRAIDIQQEQIMIQIIQETMVKFNRPERLVIYDGEQHTFEQQIELFQSANLVIGAHGGGLANLLFLLPSTTSSPAAVAGTNHSSASSLCQERPKVLEFLTNPSTPEVQFGTLMKTYYILYSTANWAEYHHVLYTPPSDGQVTFINIREFREALQAMFQPQAKPLEQTATEEVRL